MGGRLPLQRTTRALVPGNFRKRKRALPRPSAQEPQYPAACQRRPLPPQAHAQISFSAKALAPSGAGTEEILRKSPRGE
jgi:hypothetical protein